MLGPREDERVVHVAALQQVQQQRRLEMLRHRVDGVRDADGWRGAALRGLDWIARQVQRRGSRFIAGRWRQLAQSG